MISRTLPVTTPRGWMGVRANKIREGCGCDRVGVYLYVKSYECCMYAETALLGVCVLTSPFTKNRKAAAAPLLKLGARLAEAGRPTPWLAAATPMLLTLLSKGLTVGPCVPCPRTASSRCACTCYMAADGALSDEHLSELLEHRFVRISHYISDDLVSGLVADIRGLCDSAPSTDAMSAHGSQRLIHFGPGGVSSGQRPLPDEGGNPAARARLVELVAGLKSSIEDAVGTGFDADWTELQYGYYPNGGWYHRHVDSGSMGMTHPALQPGQMIKRACSFVLYLNQGWSPADGGHLRVYESKAMDAAYLDVEPEAGSIVVFKSDEVMCTARPPARPPPCPPDPCCATVDDAKGSVRTPGVGRGRGLRRRRHRWWRR